MFAYANVHLASSTMTLVAGAVSTTFVLVALVSTGAGSAVEEVNVVAVVVI